MAIVGTRGEIHGPERSRPMLRRLLVVVASSAPLVLAAQQPSVTFGGFVDTYVAWDQGRPFVRDRAFTTQAARHAEFNINLAYIDAILDGDRVRGRLALQAGTSVRAKYATEVSAGADSGALISRHIQEAVVGVRLGTGFWMDAGVFLGHVGSESWISRDNQMYTRSLIKDFSPYYESGVKFTYEWTPSVTLTGVVVNGWQNIGENNADKSIGGRLDWTLSPRISLAYYNLIGNEQPDTLPARMRFYNGVTARFALRELTLVATVDGGRQDTVGTPHSWWGGSFTARLQTTQRTTAAVRVEAFEDEHQVAIRTGQPTVPFRGWGASAGVDFEPEDGVAFRTEFRMLRARDNIFIDSGSSGGFARTNMMLVSSLAVTF